MAKSAGALATKAMKDKDASLQYLVITGLPFGDGDSSIGVASAVDCAMSQSLAELLMHDLVPDMTKQFGMPLWDRIVIALRVIFQRTRTPSHRWSSRKDSASFRRGK